jgi:hypothetical protein
MSYSAGGTPVFVNGSGATSGWVNGKSSTVPACGSGPALTLTGPAGTIHLHANDPNTYVWDGNFTIMEDTCNLIELQ